MNPAEYVLYEARAKGHKPHLYWGRTVRFKPPLSGELAELAKREEKMVAWLLNCEKFNQVP
jgi:hypothetical protein